MKKFRLHPLFIPTAILLVISGKTVIFLFSIIAVFIHESAHFFSAKNKGFSIKKLTLAPYGAVLSADCGLPDKDAFYVCAAGPVCSLSLALFTVAFWWIFPSSYLYTADFFKANLAIGIFNLLPLYPLDGSRMVLSCARDKIRCLKALRTLSVISAAVCLVLFVVSAFFTISYSLFLVAIMLLFGSLNDGKEEKYLLLFKNAYYAKDFQKPLLKKELYVTESLKIKRLLRYLKNDSVYTVYVVENGMRIKKILCEEDLEKLFFYDRDRTLGEYLIES